MAHFNLSSNRLENYDAINIDVWNLIELLHDLNLWNSYKDEKQSRN